MGTEAGLHNFSAFRSRSPHHRQPPDSCRLPPPLPPPAACTQGVYRLRLLYGLPLPSPLPLPAQPPLLPPLPLLPSLPSLSPSRMRSECVAGARGLIVTGDGGERGG